MIRTDRFMISRRLYAVDLNGMVLKECPLPGDRAYWSVRIPAVWFRRKSGVTAACTGWLWDHQDDFPATAQEALEHHKDGRHGGKCKGRWDGKRYWGAQEPGIIEAHLIVLRPMLENYPAVPPSYDGWYIFESNAGRDG